MGKLTIQDVCEIRDRAITCLSRMSDRMRLPGMSRYLRSDEQHVLAYFEASLVSAYAKVGIPMPPEIAALMPAPFYPVNEVVEGESVVHNVPGRD